MLTGITVTRGDRSFEATVSDSELSLVGEEGLAPVEAVVNSAEYAAIDGGIFQNARLSKRIITLTIELNSEDPAAQRKFLYSVAVPKQSVRLFVTDTLRGTNYIDAVVTRYERDMFSESRTVSITFEAHDPMFKSPEYTETAVDVYTETVEGNELLYDGDGDVGFEVEFTATGDSPDGVTITLTRADNLVQQLTIDYQILTGDVLRVSSRTHMKGATLSRSGVTSNMLPYLWAQSEWPFLTNGTNHICVEAAGDGTAKTYHETLYGGY